MDTALDEFWTTIRTMNRSVGVIDAYFDQFKKEAIAYLEIPEVKHELSVVSCASGPRWLSVTMAWGTVKMVLTATGYPQAELRGKVTTYVITPDLEGFKEKEPLEVNEFRFDTKGLTDVEDPDSGRVGIGRHRTASYLVMRAIVAAFQA